MRRLIVLFALACGTVAGACKRDTTVPPAEAAQTTNGNGNGNDEQTPKIQVPQVAEVLTEAFANAARAIGPSVVRVDVESGAGGRRFTQDRPRQGVPPGLEDFLERFFGDSMPGTPSPARRGTGSGVVFDRAGHVVTNAHVIEGASKVTVTLVDGREFSGQAVGRDPLTDVGVIRIVKPPSDLTMARLGDADALRIGQWVLAVGSPLGLDQMVTAGIVSGLHRGRGLPVSGERVRRYIQTDAAINPGNSGGPLVNLAGEVVGINSFINVGPGGAYGFAIPINQVAQVARTIIKDGRVRYPYLGVQVTDVTDMPEGARKELGKVPAQGAVVVDVVQGSPAAQAGLRPGDVITSIGGQPVRTAGDIVDLVSARSIGARVPVEYTRQGRTATAQVTLAEMPIEGQATEAMAVMGMALQTVTEPLARMLGIDPATRGAVVTEVQPGSAAAAAGLRPGDVIMEIDRKPVRTAEEAAAALRADEGKRKLLRVTGPDGTRFVSIGGQ